MDSATTSAVVDALKRNRRLSAEYGDALANHLSMGVVAMARLGASAAEISRFEALYRSRNALRPLTGDEPEVKPRLGDRTGEAGRIETLREEIGRRGRDATLRRHLPGLLPGLGASAFHALIRTAYAIEADDDEEVAFGLAYWQGTSLDLGTPKSGVGETGDLLTVVNAYGRHLRDGGLIPRGRMIHPRMATAARDSSFARFADAAWIGRESLDGLAALARTAFAQTLDFTALHLVTATHALRTLMPWIEDPALANVMHWRALLAAYAAMGAPPLTASDCAPRPAPSWEEVARRATATGDDHAVKLAYSARCEAAAMGQDEAYREMVDAYVRKLAGPT